jgi:hypothetical protein
MSIFILVNPNGSSEIPCTFHLRGVLVEQRDWNGEWIQ